MNLSLYAFLRCTAIRLTSSVFAKTLFVLFILQPFTQIVKAQEFSPLSESTNKILADQYRIGPGDRFKLEVIGVPDFSGVFSVGPDGALFLPRMKPLLVSGLTFGELKYFIEDQLRSSIIDPQVSLSPVLYRPIRVYVGGEVSLPGFYTLRGTVAGFTDTSAIDTDSGDTNVDRLVAFDGVSESFPTVFDAIKAARGITQFSNLKEVTVKRSINRNGTEFVQATVDLEAVLMSGLLSQNIGLYDGDVIQVGKADTFNPESILMAARSNLSPPFMSIYISGRVRTPGRVSVRQGSSLNQALSLAGGPLLLRGKVELIRIMPKGDILRSRFGYNPDAAAGTEKNPYLFAGDIIRVNENLISTGTGLLGEITSPFVGIYSLYGITQGAFK